MKGKILLGMSGGVDSSVSAALLKDAGWEVLGVTLLLPSGDPEHDRSILASAREAREVSDAMGIQHMTVDLGEDFRKYVIDYFVESYRRFETPNPCVECNRYIKFGKMFDLAMELGCSHMATGHYARTAYSEKYACNVIRKSPSVKDQSYFLYKIRREVVDRIVFPLASFTSKDEVRRTARHLGLNVASKPDSEDVCFIPGGDYRAFLEEGGFMKPSPGPVVHVNGEKLGEHGGLYRYTTGQRKGLGIAYKNPIYVVGRDPDANTLLMGDEKDLYRDSFSIRDINWLAGEMPDSLDGITVKTRYTRNEYECSFRAIGGGKGTVLLSKPQKLITAGQSAVFYDGDILLGGGIIE